jgi:hypothetical protein
MRFYSFTRLYLIIIVYTRNIAIKIIVIKKILISLLYKQAFYVFYKTKNNVLICDS